jgi:predicted alpha/beta-fold hydrolase
MLASAYAPAARGAARVSRVRSAAASTSSPARVLRPFRPRPHEAWGHPRDSGGSPRRSAPSVVATPRFSGRRHTAAVVPNALAGVAGACGSGGVLELATLVARALAAALAAAFAAFLASAWRKKTSKDAHRPRIRAPASPRMRSLLAATPALHRAIDAPLLLQSSAMQLLAYLLKQRLDPPERFERETISTPDGGEIAVDWHTRRDGDVDALPTDAPVVAVMHTLTGTARDFASFTRCATERGFRVAVLLRRGHLGRPLKTPRFNLLGNAEDLDLHVAAVKKKYPRARKLFAYAESAGTGLAVRYAGEKGSSCAFDAMTMVCPGYDTTEGGAFSRFEPFLDAHLLQSVKNTFLFGANEQTWQTWSANEAAEKRCPSFDDLANTVTMAEFQRLAYGAEGFASLEEYHYATNPMGTVLEIETPTLVINADDDPVCTPSNVDDNAFCFDGACARALVRTPIGTHCCFYEGNTLVPRNSWAHVAALEFFQAVAEEK